MPQARILIADDNESIRETVPEILDIDGYEITVYNPEKPDPVLLRKAYDVAILDIVMPQLDGFVLREEIVRHSPHVQVIVITGFPDREKLDRAMNLGSFIFLTKPFTAEQIRYAVMGALRIRRLLEHSIEQEFMLETESIGLVGVSPAMRAVRRRILELAPLDLPVLITGESGTGKDVVARCIHRFSRRNEKPLTAVNCAGLTPSLVESELFGHAQGAFTGAVKTKFGYFEVAAKGSLFLDEIGDFPLELQSRLLRVLDSGQFNRVGDTVTRTTDARIISATNCDIKQMAESGRFRADLYYRLRGSQIDLPPLRMRREDIPGITAHFLKDRQVAVAPDAMDAMMAYDWPGNVRELRMAVENLHAAAVNRIITREAVAVFLSLDGGRGDGGNSTVQPYKEFKESVVASAERGYFQTLMAGAEGNVAKAAEMAGMHRKNLYEKLKQFDIR